jgi:hypothetical protein
MLDNIVLILTGSLNENIRRMIIALSIRLARASIKVNFGWKLPQSPDFSENGMLGTRLVRRYSRKRGIPQAKSGRFRHRHILARYKTRTSGVLR